MNKLYLELISYLENDKIGKSKEILKKIIHLNNLKSQEFLYLGIKFLNSNCLDESLICLKKSLKINPNHYSAYTNIGVIYFKKFKNYNLAIKNFKESININSNNASAYYNMGCCFEEINQINEAIECYKKTLLINALHNKSRYNLGLIQLSLNDFKNGWKNYESRKKIMDINEEILGIPSEIIWDGSSSEKNIYVHSEQGIGDEILISSIYNDLDQKNNNIFISCDKRLISIFKRNFKKINFFDKNSQFRVDNNSKHIFSFSLGKYFRKNKNDFTVNKNSWIKTDKNTDKEIINKFKNLKNKRIGISWKSTEDKRKNISLLEICKIIPKEILQIVNLQYGNVKKEIEIVYKSINKKIIYFEDIDYKEDLEKLSSLIYLCDIFYSFYLLF